MQSFEWHPDQRINPILDIVIQLLLWMLVKLGITIADTMKEFQISYGPSQE